MCGVCGCGRADQPAQEHEPTSPLPAKRGEGQGEGRPSQQHEHTHLAPDGTVMRHAHGHDHHDAGHDGHPEPAHEHEHLATVTRHAHGHDHHDAEHHEHGHEHEHLAADGTVTRHAHGHDHHDAEHHEHVHEHERLAADGTVTRHAHEHDHHDAEHAAHHEHEHEHVAAGGQVLRHSHGHDHQHGDAHEHRHDAAGLVRLDQGPAGTEVAGMSQGRLVRIQQDILGKNNELAAENRARLARARCFAVNLMSSPGSGKTTLLTRTLRELKGRLECAVIEGDQQTSLDADRIRATGVKAVQINTGKGCHLDASMVGRALDQLAPPKGVLFIENVGNLVCPAGFDLGESRRVVVVSVTEGEDKPLKYPDMFAVADAVLVNKADLLPHLTFDVVALEANVQRVKRGVPLFRVSATTGQGFEAWLGWLEAGARKAAVA